ncbi:hypothetical protein GCM10008919_05640 [Selenomonas dianae]|uniref:Uncharacterized protein n=1 Tax=Selenomonas dianae TaxID=135079 RepID=A0ABP3CHF7_9FIRM
MKVLPQERERGRAFSWLPNRHHTPQFNAARPWRGGRILSGWERKHKKLM